MKRLFQNQSGTSTIELAIILPVLALLTFGAADVAMAFKTKIKYQRAAERAAQMATAGGYNSTAYNNLAADAASAAGVAANAVSVTGTLLCDGTVTTDLTCPDGQQMKRYVAISISGTYTPMFAKLMPSGKWSSTQGIALTGSASVRLQ